MSRVRLIGGPKQNELIEVPWIDDRNRIKFPASEDSRDYRIGMRFSSVLKVEVYNEIFRWTYPGDHPSQRTFLHSSCELWYLELMFSGENLRLDLWNILDYMVEVAHTNRLVGVPSCTCWPQDLTMDTYVVTTVAPRRIDFT